jgi:hypothetical protein
LGHCQIGYGRGLLDSGRTGQTLHTAGEGKERETSNAQYRDGSFSAAKQAERVGASGRAQPSPTSEMADHRMYRLRSWFLTISANCFWT